MSNMMTEDLARLKTTTPMLLSEEEVAIIENLRAEKSGARLRSVTLDILHMACSYDSLLNDTGEGDSLEAFRKGNHYFLGVDVQTAYGIVSRIRFLASEWAEEVCRLTE